MNFVIGVITHTPVWVFVLFAYLVWQGIRGMQSRSMPISRALIVPVIFILWGLSRIGFGQQSNAWLPVAWIVAALALLPIGILTPRPFEVDHATGQIIRPGSVFPLVRNVVVFLLQYVVAVMAAVHADDYAIGAIVGRAVFDGLAKAVREMKDLMLAAR